MIEEDEVWGTYSEYDFIQASNRGGYRTIDRVVIGKDGRKYPVKSQILKPHRRKDGYLQLTFHANGMIVSRLAHRVTAMTFIPNPNGLPEVNHINSNRTDNRVENLEWCSRQENITHKEKYGTSAAEALGRPLWAYNLNTGEKRHFDTQSEASRKTGIWVGAINNVIKGRVKQAGGYFFTENKNEITNEKIQSIKDNMNFFGGMIAISLETQEPLYFKTRKAAADSLKCNTGNISSVIAGRYNHTNGFWFTHADSDAIKNTRVKFGDEVASKVEQLMKKSWN